MKSQELVVRLSATAGIRTKSVLIIKYMCVT